MQHLFKKKIRATEKNHFVFLGMLVLALHHILWQRAWKREMSQRGDLKYELIKESLSLIYNIRVCYSVVDSWINSSRTKHSTGSNSALQVAQMTENIDVSLQKGFVILPKSAGRYKPTPDEVPMNEISHIISTFTTLFFHPLP